jgi:hypothetical protein
MLAGPFGVAGPAGIAWTSPLALTTSQFSDDELDARYLIEISSDGSGKPDVAHTRGSLFRTATRLAT